MTVIWKVRIAVLWIAVAVGQLASMALVLFEPGTLRDLVDGKGAGEHGAAVRIHTAVFLIGCLSVAFLTFVLKDAANRSMNGYAAGAGLVTVNLRLGLVGTFGAAEAVITVFVILALVLIIWHVWKWPAWPAASARGKWSPRSRADGIPDASSRSRRRVPPPM